MSAFKETIKDRLDPETTGDTAKKIKKIAGVVFTVGSLVLAAPVSIPVSVTAWIGWVVMGSGIIAGRASLNKSKKK